MNTPGDVLCMRMAELVDVVQAPSRVGNPAHHAFFIDGREIAHLHSDRLLDVRLPRSVQRGVAWDPRCVARTKPSDWMEFRLESDDDVEAAFELVRLAVAGALS